MDAMKPPQEVLALAQRVIDPMRDVARQHGYVIAVHGSLQRDIDLVAVPWDKEASPHRDLYAALCVAVRGVPDWRGWKTRPHRRMVRAIEIEGTYIDLSIILGEEV